MPTNEKEVSFLPKKDKQSKNQDRVQIIPAHCKHQPPQQSFCHPNRASPNRNLYLGFQQHNYIHYSLSPYRQDKIVA